MIPNTANKVFGAVYATVWLIGALHSLHLACIINWKYIRTISLLLADNFVFSVPFYLFWYSVQNCLFRQLVLDREDRHPLCNPCELGYQKLLFWRFLVHLYTIEVASAKLVVVPKCSPPRLSRSFEALALHYHWLFLLKQALSYQSVRVYS